MNKLSSKQLRRIILEEMTRLQEEREVEAIMKRVLSEESYDDRNKWNDIHHAENLRDDERDEFDHGDVAAAEEDKRHEDDLYYDAHDDKEGDHHHHHHHHHRHMEEVVNVDDTGDNDPGFNHMSAADTQAEEEKEAGPLNIGENTEHLSRGSLYRRRYYGRY